MMILYLPGPESQAFCKLGRFAKHPGFWACVAQYQPPGETNGDRWRQLW